MNSFGIVLLVVVVVQILLMIGLNLYQTSRLNKITTAIANDQSTLNSVDNRDINDQLEQILAGTDKLKTAVNGKINWNKFYQDLGRITPKDVRLSSISVTNTGGFKAEGQAGSYSSLAEALVAWEQGVSGTPSPLSSVQVTNNSSSSDQNRVSFSLSGQVNLGSLGL